MIQQDDLLKTVVKRIATLEEESCGELKVASVGESSVGENPTGASKQVSEIEEIINRTLEQKLGQLGRVSKGPLSVAVCRGGKQTGRQRPGPKPTDVCRLCNRHGHWSQSCPTLNKHRARQGHQHQPTNERVS